MNYFKMNQFTVTKKENGRRGVFIMIFGYWVSFEIKLG